MAIKFVFLLLPEIQLLDLSGSEQVIYEAMGDGADFEIEYCSIQSSIKTSAGLTIDKLKHFEKVVLNQGDFVFIPGPETHYLLSKDFVQQKSLFNWVKSVATNKVNICSICSGAYVLAYSGILNNKPCTTHWQRTTDMQQRFPQIQVVENVLFIKHENIYTSAGILAGIDMTLFILEELKGTYFTHKIARELVMYNRRSGSQPQQSEFLNYRNHIHSGIHKVQDWLHQNLDNRVTLIDLAFIAGMSDRNFTRIFKKETGITVNKYINILRKERIRELLKNPNISRIQIAKRCGLKSDRQVNRLIRLK
ncbi:MAG: DJ-1/PfpI family protein [Bacteroidetes bacterium]|nr:DJ-1/PfpI family protein [Bacteroidota bacterium]MBK9800413.1 DJ-1/PfpI family protein [Bacteroidota bacterium]